MHISTGSGLHPALLGGVSVGVHKYLGVFALGGNRRLGDSASGCMVVYCASASAKLNPYQLGGGLEVVASDRSRFVPYGRFGAAYAGANGSYRVSGVGNVAG